MLPRIFNWDATEFNSLGMSVLSDCISCEVSEAINDQYELTLRYKYFGVASEELIVRNIIAVKANAWQPVQAFRIYKTRRTAPNELTAYARHLSYDLSGYPVAPFNTTGIDNTLAALSNTMITPFPFTLETTLEDDATQMSTKIPCSVKSCMGGKAGTIVTTFGGEWEYDNYSCLLRPRRGEDKGVRISYGNNLVDYQKERSDDVYSHCIAYYKYKVGGNDAIIIGDPIRTGINSVVRCVYYDASRDYQEAPSVQDLNFSAGTYISEHTANDAQTVTAAILQSQNVEIGDTVHINYGDDIFSTRIVKTTYDVLAEKYTKLELGTLKPGISTTIKSLNERSYESADNTAY